MLIFKGKPENGPVQHTTLSESMLYELESKLDSVTNATVGGGVKGGDRQVVVGRV